MRFQAESESHFSTEWKISSLSVLVMVLRPVLATTGTVLVAVVATTEEGSEVA